MCRMNGVLILAVLIFSGCGNQESAAERRHREALDLSHKGQERLNANDKTGAESLLRRALEVDPQCENARAALDSMKAKERAALKAARDYVNLCRMALEVYEATMSSYPTTSQGLAVLWHQPDNLPDPTKWEGPYLNGPVPKDPWGNPYQYVCPGKHNPDTFDVWSFGPDSVNGTQDDIGNWGKP